MVVEMGDMDSLQQCSVSVDTIVGWEVVDEAVDEVVDDVHIVVGVEEDVRTLLDYMDRAANDSEPAEMTKVVDSALFP